MFLPYLLTFSASLLLSLALTWYVRRLARAHGWLEKPRLERHVHTSPMPRLGGVAICAAFMVLASVSLFVPGRLGLSIHLPLNAKLAFLGSGLIIFALGFYDDLRGVNAYVKFGVQALAAMLLYFGGLGIHRFDLIPSGPILQSFIGLPLTILWVLLITNAFNLIDGLDGLAAGSALFSTVVVFIVSLIVPNPVVTCLAIALAGAILGFLGFNFHPATIFLGDSGSLFIGFILSALALAGSQKAPTMVAVAIPVVSLGLPLMDVALAIVRRFLAGKPLFAGDRQHIHHKLLNRGLSQRDAVLILYAVTACFGFLSLILLHQGATIALVLAVVGIGILVGVQQLRYQELDEIMSIFQRVTHRRQIFANHVAIRHAAESLNECNDFSSICSLLRHSLQPSGFDGIRLQMLNPNGFPASAFQPLNYLPDGNMVFVWSERDLNEPPWELRLELVTSGRIRWGYVTLIRGSQTGELLLDVNVLRDEFQTSLSNALDRACGRLANSNTGKKIYSRQNRIRKLAAGSMSD